MKEKLAIADAKRLASRKGYDGLIIIGVRNDGFVDGVSYGCTRKKCAALGRWLDALIDRYLPLLGAMD